MYISDTRMLIFLTGEESLKFGGVNFQRTESGRFINKNGQELSNDAMTASKFLRLGYWEIFNVSILVHN